MPHNIYIHSSWFQTRNVGATPADLKQACKFNLIDSVIALNCAFFVNAAILILAAAAFNATGHSEVAELKEAHSLLTPLLGTSVASFAFAIALLCAGQASTLTGTMAGQIVMEGFLHLRISAWLRRLLTRSLAIIPATLVIGLNGEEGVDELLIFSQVFLSLQLPFAIIPLINFTSDRKKMGEFSSGLFIKIMAWLIALIIVGLNGLLVFEKLSEWIHSTESIVPWLTAVPLVAALIALLGWLIVFPWLGRTAKSAS
jgi:manganese transport protein